MVKLDLNSQPDAENNLENTIKDLKKKNINLFESVRELEKENAMYKYNSQKQIIS